MVWNTHTQKFKDSREEDDSWHHSGGRYAKLVREKGGKEVNERSEQKGTEAGERSEGDAEPMRHETV